jgi:hypothetical protein
VEEISVRFAAYDVKRVVEGEREGNEIDLAPHVFFSAPRAVRVWLDVLRNQKIVIP